MFANALRTHSRLRVLSATRIALPATRSITSLVAFRTAVPKKVSLSVPRSFTTSQVARNEAQVAPEEVTPKESDLLQVVAEESEVSRVAAEELEGSQVAPEEVAAEELEATQIASKEVAAGELEDSQVALEEVAPAETEDSQVPRNGSEDGAPTLAPGDVPSNTVFVGNVHFNAKEEDITKAFSEFGEVTNLRLRAFFFFSGRFLSTAFFLKNYSHRHVPEWSSSRNCSC